MKQLAYLLNALDVLEAVARPRSGSSLSAIARDLEFSKSGVFRILATLESRGYVLKNESGNFEIGPRLFEFGASMPQKQLLTIATPLMERVTASTNESTYLSVLTGFSMVTIHTVEPTQTIRVHMPVGASAPANCTVSGLAMLANLHDHELQAILPEHLEGTAPDSIVDKAKLLAELGRIRARGYAISVGSWKPDTGGGAAPIFNKQGRVIATFGAAAPISRLSPERLEMLAIESQKAATEISAAMGFVAHALSGSLAARGNSEEEP